MDQTISLSGTSLPILDGAALAGPSRREASVLSRIVALAAPTSLVAALQIGSQLAETWLAAGRARWRSAPGPSCCRSRC